jgi:hypothetical protein
MTGEHLTENGTLPNCPAQLVVESHISLLEEHWMGIERERTHSYRVQNNFPNSDAVEALQEELMEASRKRAASNVSHISSSRQPPPSKVQRRAVE